MTARRLPRGGLAALVAAGALLAACAGADLDGGAAARRTSDRSGEALRLDPKGLIGLDAPRLRQLLGAPQFVRQEPTAEVWRYRYGNCLVYLFLYADGPAAVQPPRLRHIELRGLAGPVATPADCRPAPERSADAAQS
jgi:hypothetical protein